MTTSAFKKVQALALNLSNKELEDAISLFRKLQSNKGEIQKAEQIYEHNEAEDDLFYNEIKKYLNKMNGSRYPELYALKRVKHDQFMMVVTARETLDSLLHEWINSKTRKDKIKFFKLYCRVVGNHIIHNTRQELSLRTMLQFIDEYPAILDRSFPGYVRSGMLPLILSKL